jgi:threonine aldolase
MMQSQIPGIDVNEDDVGTNIVFFHITPDAKLDAATLVQRLDNEKGILVGGTCIFLASRIVWLVRAYVDTSCLCVRSAVVAGGYWNGQKVRAVTNLHISAQDIAYAVASIRDLMT